jgi:hypothetical protein
MEMEHFTHFATLSRIAGAEREASQAGRGLGSGSGEGTPGDLRAQSIEKLDQDFKIVIHRDLNARVFDSCKKSSFRPKKVCNARAGARRSRVEGAQIAGAATSFFSVSQTFQISPSAAFRHFQPAESALRRRPFTETGKLFSRFVKIFCKNRKLARLSRKGSGPLGGRRLLNQRTDGH